MISKNTVNKRYLVLFVKVAGSGINSQIFPRLFTKCGTETGAARGLGVSKSII